MLFDVLTCREEDILAIRAAAFEQLKAGQVVMAWSSEGSSANLSFPLPIERIIEETTKFLKAKNPTKYGRHVKRATVCLN